MMIDNYSLGARIKLRRKQLKLSQEELAEKLYVTRQMITNYENDKVDMKLSVLYEIAKGLEISPLWFLLPVWNCATEENEFEIAEEASRGLNVMYIYFSIPLFRRDDLEDKAMQLHIKTDRDNKIYERMLRRRECK